VKLTDVAFDKVLKELLLFTAGGNRHARRQRFEWLHVLSETDGFFEGAFDSDQSISSRHPANWLLALAARMPRDAADGLKPFEWYAGALLTANERRRVGDDLLSGKWVRTFLKLTRRTVAKWEKGRLTGRERPYLRDRETLEHLQNTVRLLVKARWPVALDKAIDLAPEWRREVRRDLLFAGLRHLLFYPCVHGDALCLAAWPQEGARIAEKELTPRDVLTDVEIEEAKRPRFPDLPPPLAHAPQKQYGPPRMQQDLFCFLQAVRNQRLQVKADGALYAKSAGVVAAGLAALPEWLHLDLTARANAAFGTAWGLEWITVKEPGRRSRIETTRAGEAWLAEPPARRTVTVLDLLRAPHALEYSAVPAFFHGLPFEIGARKRADGQTEFAEEVRDYLREFFDRLTEGAFCERDALLTGAGDAAHPFRGRLLFTGTRKYMSRTPLDQVDELWHGFVARFLAYPLHACGGMLYGVSGGKLYVALTAAGRYLLGLTDELAPAEEAGRVVLQPNFELVFVAPSASAMAALAPYSRRIGGGEVGALFRLDRNAVLAAVRQGADADSILADLSAYVEAVPDNVAAEVRSWCESTLRVKTSRLVVIECPDKLSAARVLAAGGKHLKPLTETVLKLKPGTKTAALSRALAKHGIFLNR